MLRLVYGAQQKGRALALPFLLLSNDARPTHFLVNGIITTAVVAADVFAVVCHYRLKKKAPPNKGS